jgi:hypothetical protein
MTTNRDTALNTVYPNKGNTALGDLFCSGDITYMEFALAVLIPAEGGWMIKLGPDVPFHATSAPDYAAT